MGKEKGLRVTETANSALTLLPVGTKIAGNDVIRKCVSGLVC